MSCHKRRGFSRAETVIVLGAAGISMALLLPATAQGGLFDVFARARENARRSSCQTNLKQIGLGVMMYTQDYDEKYPPATSSNKYGYGWADLIQPYIKSTQMYQCPSEKHPAPKSVQPKRAGYIDYWFNSRFSRLTLDKLVAPAYTLLLGDGDGGSIQSNARYNLSALPSSWKTAQGSPATRHLGGANYAFADGHIKWFLPKRITTTPLGKRANRGSAIDPTFAIK